MIKILRIILSALVLLGGHSFDRLDTKQANEIRLKIYKYLARYLSPPNPFQSENDLSKAGYQ